MRIALAVADMVVGGVQTFVLNLGSALRAAGHDVTIMTFAGGKGKWRNRIAAMGLNEMSISIPSWRSIISHTNKIASGISHASFDIVVSNIGRNNSLMQLSLHRLPEHVRVLLVLHNDHPGAYRLAAKNAAAWNCAVGVSPGVQQNALLHLPDKPILCIPYGIDLPTAAELQSRAAWELPLRLLFVGRLKDRQKGILRLPPILAACRRNETPVRLTVIGDGPDQQELSLACKKYGVDDLVEMRGAQPNLVVLEAMRSHHALLFPSNYEGLGIVLLEAQANGCVPIVSRLPGVTDAVIEEGRTGTSIDKDNAAGFAEAIAAYASSQEQWQVCSHAASRRAQQLFSVEHMTQQYLHILQDLERSSYPLSISRTANRHAAEATLFTWRDHLPSSVFDQTKRLKYFSSLRPRRPKLQSE